MKTLYIIGGTMGVGKTAVCQVLKSRLPRSVFLDGDWCWDADPFVVNDETRRMAMDNITCLLASFLRCSVYENVLFCWVMHEQSTIDEILSRLALDGVSVRTISLVCTPETLKKRLESDVLAGKRTADVAERNLKRLPLYRALNTKKIDTSDLSVVQTAEEIIKVL